MNKRKHETYWDEKAGLGFMNGYSAVRQSMFDLIKPKFHGNVLDVGAGICLLYPQIKDRVESYTMADFTLKFCEEGKKRYPEIETYHASALNLPFEDKQFDVSTAIALFRHILPEDMPKAISELLRVAKKTIICWSIIPQHCTCPPKVKESDGFIDVIHNFKDVQKAINKPFCMTKVSRFMVYDI